MEDKIRNNPTAAKMRKDMEGFQALLKIAPALEWIGLVKKGSLTEHASKAAELAQQFEKLTSVPDRFNELFGEMGWVASESSNFEMMEKAIALGDANKKREAEQHLVEYYTKDNLRFGLNQMRGLEAWWPRIELAEKAMEDHLAGRYHASVPVVLSLMDGLVNDVEPTGFFAEQTDLTAWDSISGHSTGLTALATLFRKGRTKTTTEEITIPYRNGILHGRDLGYANKTVATKVWAALFVAGSWARLVESGKKHEQPPKQEPTWRELFAQMNKNKKSKELLDAWKPRVVEVGSHCPKSGSANDYEEGSPEQCFVFFLELWKRSNYGKMAEVTKDFLGLSLAERAGATRKKYEKAKINSFELISIEDRSAGITEIKAKISIQNSDEWKEISARMIYEDEEGATPRGAEWGKWKVLGVTLNPAPIGFDYLFV